MLTAYRREGVEVVATGRRCECSECQGVGFTAWWWGHVYEFRTCVECEGRGSVIEFERYDRRRV
jgi:DnaJ-class molecular chaperone